MRISYVATGGTISSSHSDGVRGVVPRQDGESISAGIPDIGIEFRVLDYACKPSPELSLEDVASIAALAASELNDPECAGLVITQGTDCIEEMAFALSLVHRSPKPVAISGAMRHPGSFGYDGEANVLAAMRVAASPESVDRGVLVVLNDEIHSGWTVRKTHTASPSAFASAPGGLGWVVEDRVTFVARVDPPTQPLSIGSDRPRVGIVTTYPGDDGHLLRQLDGFDGLVLEGLGGGHVPSLLVPALDHLTSQIPVILASRTGAGPVLENTYGFPGSEIDLLNHGLVPSGYLDARKARVALELLLSGPHDAAGVRDFFGRFRGHA